MHTPENIPVIVAVGEFTDRPQETAQALEPIALMAEAIKAANADGGGNLLSRIDTVDLVGLVSWRYTNPVRQLCQRLDIAPTRQRNASMGGETPLRLIHDAALAISRGEQQVAAIVGGEAMNAVNKARKQKIALDWTPLASRDEAMRFANDRIEISPISKLIGVRDPSQMYPLYEMAAQKAWGQTPIEGDTASSALWADYAAVAAENPFAWLRHAPSAEDIGAVSASNRYISWPYPKLMVANPAVNQGAAIIVASLAAARDAGVPEDKLIHIHGGAAAAEADDYLYRDRYDRSSAQTAVLAQTVELVGGNANNFSKVELYSCFPVVPKMALKALNLKDGSIKPTVAGGLTFFGGPLNNYMSHATCAMVKALRCSPGELGLLYGQGGFVTKHHSLVLSTAAAPSPLAQDYSVQAEADQATDPLPRINPEYSGPASIETYTIQYGRDGETEQGVVIVRSPDGQRSLARVGADDAKSLGVLLDKSQSAVGVAGQVSFDAEARPNWQVAINE